MGLFDFLSADPGSAKAMQAAGLFGGLQALGAGLAQAGQMRPVGQPGPTLGDAFLGFNRGHQAGLLGAYQQGQIDRKTKIAGLLSEIKSGKPIDQMSPEAQRLAPIVSSLPPEVLQFADADTLPGMMVQRGTGKQRQLTPEELKAGGYRPGSVVMVNDWTGTPNVVQQPDYKSPEAEAQALRIAAAGRQPPAPTILGPGQVAIGRDGRPIAFGPMPKDEPLTPANAWNDILRYQGQVEAGTLDPTSPEGRRYIAAQEILLQPKPVQITQPDGSVIQVLQQPQLTFPRLTRPAPAAASEGALPGPAQPGATPAQPGAIPPASGVQVKPPPPLTESQGNATMFYGRMTEAEKRIAEVEAKGYKSGNLVDTLAGKTGMAGNWAMTPEAQQYKQAASDWITALLRKESGAVISEQEFNRYFPQFFPQPGDSPQVIAQKAASRRTTMDGLRQATGAGASRLDSAQPPPPPSAPQAAPTVAADRKANTVYQTPKGPMMWTGTGWLPAK